MNLLVDDSTTAAASGLRWTEGFRSLGPAFFTALQPTPLPAPYWVGRSAGAAHQLGVDAAWLASDEALDVLTGNALLPGMAPLASVYSGHQFGVWAGQLGDGRAILLGETDRGLEVPVAVPRQRGDAVAEEQVFAFERIGDLAGAARHVGPGVAVDVAFDPSRHDLAVAVVALGELDQGRDQ